MIKTIFIFCVLSLYVLNAKNVNSVYLSLQWVQSNEYKLLCTQVYKSAQREFDKLDLKKVRSVLIDNSVERRLPLAVVTDIDETILLNYDFQKKLLEDDLPFSYKLFNKYIVLGNEVPVNGSLEYFQYLSKKGVKIIYISNREASTEEATYNYLKRYGYPIESKEDLLLKDERKQWTSDKSTRREFISSRYTVIQMFGDNLYDFIQTQEELSEYKNKFGTSWFLLPNPIYGNWKK